MLTRDLDRFIVFPLHVPKEKALSLSPCVVHPGETKGVVPMRVSEKLHREGLRQVHIPLTCKESPYQVGI